MTISSYSIGEEGIGGESEGLPGIIFIPPSAVAVSANAPIISTGIRILAPNIAVAVQKFTPGIKATVFQDNPFGDAIGEESIATASISAGGLTSTPIILPPALSVSVAKQTPGIFAGKSVFIGSVSVTTETWAPVITQSATINVPEIALVVGVGVPKLEINIHIPYIFVGVLLNIPKISTGKQILVPGISTLIQEYAPTIRSGVKIEVPNLDVEVTLEDPVVSIGLNIKAWNTNTIQVPLGAIGSSAISSNAIGEDEDEPREVTFSAIIQIVANAPDIYTGKQVKVPLTDITISTHRPEISARTRRVRAQIISY